MLFFRPKQTTRDPGGERRVTTRVQTKTQMGGGDGVTPEKRQV